MPRNGIQNLLRNRLNPCQRLFCVYIVIFGEDEGKSYHILRIETKTRECDVCSAERDDLTLLRVYAAFCQRAAGVHHRCCRFLALCAKLRSEERPVAFVIITPDQRLQPLPRGIARIAHIVEIMQLILRRLVAQNGNAACIIAQVCIQIRPCRSGRIRRTRCTPVKEQTDLRRDRVTIVFCHRAEKVDESVLVEAQIGIEPVALLDQCMYARHSVSLLP